MVREQPPRVGQPQTFDRNRGDANTTRHCRKSEIDNGASSITVSAQAAKGSAGRSRGARRPGWKLPGFATHTASPVSPGGHRRTKHGRIRLAFGWQGFSGPPPAHRWRRRRPGVHELELLAIRQAVLGGGQKAVGEEGCWHPPSQATRPHAPRSSGPRSRGAALTGVRAGPIAPT